MEKNCSILALNPTNIFREDHCMHCQSQLHVTDSFPQLLNITSKQNGHEMAWSDCTNGMVRLHNWHGQTAQCAWSDYSNGMVRLLNWHGQTSQMAWSDYSIGMVRLLKWQGQTSPLAWSDYSICMVRLVHWHG
jgi:hypothetical protein